MKIAIVVFLGFASQALGFNTDWTQLAVTWNPNIFSSFSFAKMPINLKDNKDFELRDDLCATAGGKLLGQRYWAKKDKDPALNLLFDKNGYIAGIQNSILKSKFTPPVPAQNTNYADDGDYWTLTAYFIDPSLICGAGRTEEEFKKTGTGTGLWLQIGPNALTDTMQIPLNEPDIKKTKWGSGKCFFTMGQHYWYNVTKGMSCDNFFPNCMLYNRGKLNSFCFAANVKLDSQRYDNPHPTAKVIHQFMDPVPDCFFTDPTYAELSTIHVYFSKDPQLTSYC